MLLTSTPAALQLPGKMGFVRQGAVPVRPHQKWHERFGQAEHYAPNRNEGESNNPFSFYYSPRQWHFDPTLKYQAPRPGSHAWYDETLTYQGERGPDQFGAAGEVGQMSTGVKIAIALGASALLVGGAVLVVRHTLLEEGF